MILICSFMGRLWAAVPPDAGTRGVTVSKGLTSRLSLLPGIVLRLVFGGFGLGYISGLNFWRGRLGP